MKLVTAAVCACALALLSGCQAAQQAQREALEAEVKARITQAVQACHAQRFPTSVARAQCRTDAEAQARPFFPYPDLLDQRLAARLALAHEVDRKQLSEREAQRAFGRTMEHLLTEDARRAASGPTASVQDAGVAPNSTTRRALEAGFNALARPAAPQPSAPTGQLAAVRVIQRTCVRDAAGNQTCRETEEPNMSQAPAAANTGLAGPRSLSPSAPAGQRGAAEPVGLAAAIYTRDELDYEPKRGAPGRGGARRLISARARSQREAGNEELASE